MTMRRSSPLRAQLGLSLVELMVSMTLGLIVLSGVLVVFVNSSAARNEVERTTRQIENGRYAVELLTEDLRLGGYYGELDGTTVATPPLPTDPCSLTAGDWKNWVPIHTQGYDNAAFASANCALTNRKAGTDVLVVRRASTCLGGATSCPVTTNRPYVQVSLCPTQAPQYLIGVQGTDAFTMQTKTCSAATLATKREYFVHIYFIAEDTVNGVTTPSLKRLELTGDAGGGPRWDIVPLVEGIEELQIMYGVDTDKDGVPESYVASPATVNDWVNVVTVQFYVLARNLESSPNYKDEKVYTLGKTAAGVDYTVGPRNDGYRRHVYSSLVRIMNPAGKRDTP